MADTTTDTTTTPPPATTDTTPPPATTAAPDTTALEAEIAKLKGQVAGFETAETARKNAELSDVERAQNDATASAARATALETKLVKRDALDALKGANVIDPDLAYLAIKDEIKVKDGEGENIKALVEKFVKDRPAMVKAADAKAPQTHSTNGGSGGTSTTGRKNIPGKI